MSSEDSLNELSSLWVVLWTLPTDIRSEGGLFLRFFFFNVDRFLKGFYWTCSASVLVFWPWDMWDFVPQPGMEPTLPGLERGASYGIFWSPFPQTSWVIKTWSSQQWGTTKTGAWRNAQLVIVQEMMLERLVSQTEHIILLPACFCDVWLRQLLLPTPSHPHSITRLSLTSKSSWFILSCLSRFIF